MTSELARLLQRRLGLQHVQTRAWALEYRAGTPEGDHFAENIQLILQTALPFMRKWSQVPEDYEQLCQQAFREMQDPDFVATWDVLTAWGINRE